MTDHRTCAHCGATFAAGIRRVPGCSEADVCPCGGALVKSTPVLAERDALRLEVARLKRRAL
jgi:hypothetical protein